MNNKTGLESKLDTETSSSGSFVKNWAIDTSAKAATFTPLLATMEALTGLSAEQILKSRLMSLAVDSVCARGYTKTADYLCNKLHVDPKNGGAKAWAIDTSSMILNYAPVYAGILYANGASSKQIVKASIAAAGIATVTSRPFRKYVLFPWREYCSYGR